MHQKHLHLKKEMKMKKCHIKIKKSRSPVPPPPSIYINIYIQGVEGYRTEGERTKNFAKEKRTKKEKIAIKSYAD